jgi:hypothetical protein
MQRWEGDTPPPIPESAKKGGEQIKRGQPPSCPTIEFAGDTE